MAEIYFITCQDDYDKYCELREENPEYAKKTLVIENQKKDGTTIQVFGNDIIYAYGDFRVQVFDDVTMICNGHGQLNLKENSVAYCFGSIEIQAEDTSRAITSGNCVCRAHGCSYIKAYDECKVYASQNSIVESYGTCQAYVQEDGIVEGYEMSLVRVFDKTSSVYAGGCCTVISDYRENVKLYDNARIVSPNMTTQDWIDYHNVPVENRYSIKLYKKVFRWRKSNNCFTDFDNICYRVGEVTVDNVDSAYRQLSKSELEDGILCDIITLSGYTLDSLLMNISLGDFNDKWAFLELQVDVPDIIKCSLVTDNILHEVLVHKFTVVREVPKEELLRMCFNERNNCV